MTKTSRYEQSGVSTDGADSALDALKGHILATHGFNYRQPVTLGLGYFANVIDIGGGQGLAFCTDGVGTKVRVAELTGKYDTLGIDCVAMNVNDLICVGARPVSLVDYIACAKTDAAVFAALGKGLAEGARQARIHISGGEISQVPEIVNGIDLIGSAVGLVPLEAVNTGRDVKPGQVLVGLDSTGVHANGLTLARRVLLGECPLEQKEKAARFEEGLGRTLGGELLAPTRIYVQAVLAVQEVGLKVRAMVNITGGGVCNLNRVAAEGVRFVIDTPPEPQPVFRLIQERGGVSDAEMYEVFNMGIGFVLVMDDVKAAATALTVCAKFNVPGRIIGRVETGDARSVTLPQIGLTAFGSEIQSAS
ncbi:MAG: phosphoribosylformylglycinamidine cyclo-ligase [Nitrospinaceae bacterium]